MTVSRARTAIAWRYALAPVCVGAAALLHLAPVGVQLHPMAGFIVGVVATAWVGGAGPGVLAAFLSALMLDYPFLGDVFDWQGFIALGLTGVAVGSGRASYKRTQSKLRDLVKSGEQYTRVMAAAQTGFWDWDVLKDEYVVSPRLLEMAELPPDTIFADREDFLRRTRLYPEDRVKWQQAVRQLFKSNGSRVAMDVRSMRSGGRFVWQHLDGICFRDAAGKVVRWTGSVTDISERKHAEEALRKSEQRYARVMQASEDGFWEWIAATDELYVSPRMLAIYRLPPDTVFHGRNDFLSRFPFLPEDLTLWREAVAAHLASETPRVDVEVRATVQAETRWLHLTAVCQRDASGAEERWTGSVRDVTDRRRAQEALRVSEERYALAMRASGEGHWDWKIPTDEFYASPRYLELAGFPPDMRFSRRSDIVPLLPFHPDDHAPYEAAVAAHFAGETPRVDMVIRLLPKGKLRWLHVIGTCSRDADGKPVRWAGSVTDITAHKLAEEALRLSEERHALAMEASQEGHFDWNVETDQIFASERLKKVLRLPPEFKYRTRQDMVSRMPFSPQEAERVAQMARKVLGGNALEHEFEYHLQAGEFSKPCFIKARWKIFRDARGVAQRVIGVVSDITERKRVEEALRQSEERYSLAVEGSNEGIFDWDLESDRVYVSYRAQELFGLPRGELWRPRRDWRRILDFHPDDAPGLHGSIKAHIEGGSPTYDVEFRVIEPGGGVRWYRQRGIALRDASGTAYRVVGSIGDITERKRAEEKLRESEALKSAMFESALDSIISIDHDGRVIEFNPAAERTFGYRRAQAIGKELAELIVPPQLRERHRRGLARYLATGEARVLGKRLEMSAVRADGTEFPVELTVTRIAAEGAPLFTAFLRDITERKRAEEALRLSEERYALAVAGSDDGVWDVDFLGRRVFASARARELAGLPPGPEIVSMDEYFATLPVHPDDVQRRGEAFAAHLSGKAPAYEIELRLRQQDGTYRWRRLHGLCIRNADGVPQRMAGSIADIDERYRTVEALRLSEERYSYAMEAAQDAHWDWIVGTDHYYVSPRASDVLGFPPGTTFSSREDYLARTPLLKEDLEVWLRKVRELFAGTGLRLTMDIRAIINGEVRWIQHNGLCVRDASGKVIRWGGSTRDVTERRRAEEALRLSEERYALALEASEEGHFDIDVATDELFLSDRMLEIYGYPPGTRFNKRDEFMKQYPFYGNDAEIYKAVVGPALAKGGPNHYEFEFRIVRPSGEVRWLWTRAKIRRDAEGNAVRRTGMARDVTDAKLAEQAMRKMELQLRRAQRLEAIGTLAGGIAHDFNNILGAILGYGEMAMRSAKKATRLRRDLDNIMVAGERGRALVDRVLAFSRSGLGERVPVHVQGVVSEALDQVAARAPANVTIIRRLRAGRAAVLGDSTQVHQVVMNLAANAVQAMQQGGVLRVSLDTARNEAPRAALVGTAAPGEQIVLKVADSGSGIRPDVLEQMFDPFFTTKDFGVGSGLGLSLVHGIVLSLGGAIDVATELGKGTTFTVYLPRSGEMPTKVANDRRPLPRGKGQRVLVVDDEEVLVRLAIDTLEGLGYAPVGFTSSANALQEFGADPGRFDAILTDERMPGVTGSAIIREVRRINASIPILLMSGFVGGTVAKARELGANEVLQKPLRARELATSLARVLGP